MLSTVVVPGESPTGTILLLHGLGASGDDLAPLVPHLQRPDLRVVLPHAPFRAMSLWPGPAVRSWYDIVHAEWTPGREYEPDVRASAEAIRELIEAERARGVPSERIVVAGFSQGGAMALHVALRWPERLAAVVAMSTYLLVPHTLHTEFASVNHGIDAFFAHGVHDGVVPLRQGRLAIEALGDRVRPEPHEYSMQHEVCLPELKHLRSFLNRVIPPVSTVA